MQLIGWLEESRRIVTRFEKAAVNFSGMVKLAFIHRYFCLSGAREETAHSLVRDRPPRPAHPSAVRKRSASNTSSKVPSSASTKTSTFTSLPYTEAGSGMKMIISGSVGHPSASGMSGAR